MPLYVALLRGIAPTNPNMRNEKLRSVFEKLGFKKVQTVISSGNVIFASRSKNAAALEKKIETALPKYLGFTSTTIIRSQQQLQTLVDTNPFKGIADTSHSYLNVTFLKNSPKLKLKLPFKAENKTWELVALHDRAVCSSIDLAGAKTPDLMSWLEKQYGKEITTRTWKTVGRILTKMKSTE